MKIAKPLFVKIQTILPVVCVDLVVRDAQSRVLMLKRANPPAKGEWWFPGGRVHYGELRIDAAKRKLREECGLAAVSMREAGTFEVIFDEGAGGKRHSVSTIFFASVTRKRPILDLQSVDYRWKHAQDWLQEVRYEFLRDVLVSSMKSA